MGINEDYLIVSKKVLPNYFEKVIQIKSLITQNMTISDACKEVGLSRSTFYKYKDYVHLSSGRNGRRIILSLKVFDEPGVLSNILNFVAESKGNILAITQEMPIHNIAFVTLTIDAIGMNMTIQTLVSELRSIKEVMDVLLIAVE